MVVVVALASRPSVRGVIPLAEHASLRRDGSSARMYNIHIFSFLDNIPGCTLLSILYRIVAQPPLGERGVERGEAPRGWTNSNPTQTSVNTSQLPSQLEMWSSRRQPPTWGWLDLRMYQKNTEPLSQRVRYHSLAKRATSHNQPSKAQRRIPNLVLFALSIRLANKSLRAAAVALWLRDVVHCLAGGDSGGTELAAAGAFCRGGR